MNKKILVIIILGIVCIILGVVFFYGFLSSPETVIYGASFGSGIRNGFSSDVSSYEQNPELGYFNVTLDNGLKISYRGYTITYQPVFIMENGQRFTWSQIPDTIGKDLWKIKVSPSKYKYGADFSNVSDNIRNNLKYVVLHRTNATKQVWNNMTNTTDIVPMTLADAKGKIKIQGNSIIINNDVTISHDDVLRTYSIPLINRSDIVIGNLNNTWEICWDWDNAVCVDLRTYSNWIDNGDGTWNITFDPTISLDGGDIVSTSLLTNVTAETGNANFTHLNMSTTSPYDKLVGYWNFDGDVENVVGTTIYDFSKNGNDGINTLNSRINSSSGIIGNGAFFDGADGYVNMSGGANVDNLPEITVTAWVKPFSEGGASRAAIVDKRSGGGGENDWFFGYDAGFTNSITFFKGFDDPSVVLRTGVDNTIPLNTWTHVAMTWNGSGACEDIHLYTNGTEVSYQSCSNVTGSPGDDSSRDLLIGNQMNDGNGWDGFIDEVMLFNETLTDQQILDIYNNASARFLPTGTQRVRAVNITNTTNWDGGGFNRVNLSTTIQENKDSLIEARIGQINLSVDPYGLELYMPFEWGSAVDISGNGLDGSIEGSTYFNETGGLNDSGGFEFDGVADSGIDLGLGFNTSGWNEMAVSAWVKSPVGTPFENKNIVIFGNSGSDRVFSLTWSTNQDVGIDFYNTANTKSDGNCQDCINNTNWHHVVGVLNGTNALMYVDGVLGTADQDAFTGTLQTFETGSDGLWIGQNGLGGAVWNGTIDNVMIWNRSLSLTEITQMYNNQSAEYNIPYYTPYQNITSDTNETFNISTEADFVFPDYLQRAGNSSVNPFYSPLIENDISIEAFTFTAPAPPTPPTNITVESDDNNHTHLTINNLTAPYDDLYGYWSFDGDNVNTIGARAYDWSSRQLDTPLLNGTVINSTAGFIGNGLSLQVEGDSVDLGENFHTDYLTVSAWVNSRISNFGSESKMISSDIGPGSTVEWQIFGLLSDTSYRLRVDTAGGFTTLDTSSFNTADTWYHIVGTFNGTNMSIYVNGVLNVSTGHSNPGVIKTLGNNRSIGATGVANRNGSWDGFIDEVMIFNVSLTPTQVLDIYNNQSDRFFPTGILNSSNQTITSGNDRLNVSTTISNDFNSSINLTIEYYNGSWFSTAPQTIVSDTDMEFVISDATTVAVANYTFIAGNSTTNPFYTPIIHGQSNFTNWTSTPVQPVIHLDVITPPDFNDLNVTFHEFFNVTVNVTCRNANCGEVNVSLDPKVETRTTTTDTICQNGICNKILYSGIRNVYEDGQWKRIENARSLKNKGFVINIVSDGVHNVNVIDFNYSSIEFDLSFDSGNVVGYEHEIEDGKMKTKFKIKHNSTYEEEYEVEVEDGGLIYKYEGNPFGKEFHFGENSTTIQLQDANTENLDDTYIAERSTSSNYGSASQLYTGLSWTAGKIFKSYIKFNISSIPGDMDIVDSELCLFISTNAYDSGEYATSWIHELDNHTWDESIPTWDDPVLGVGSQVDEITGIDGDWVNFWLCHNATSWVSSEYDDLESNVSFMWNSSYLGTTDYLLAWSKEYGTASLRPYLNITYSENSPKSGLINDTIGAIPFYTNESNPRNITLSKDESQLVTFWVNATGTINETSVFHAFVNQTSNTSISNITSSWNVTIRTAAPPSDTCTYTSGDWNIDCSDFCNISSNVDVLGNNISVTGVGQLTLTANITNYTRRFFLGQDINNKCTIRGFGGWFHSKS